MGGRTTRNSRQRSASTSDSQKDPPTPPEPEEHHQRNSTTEPDHNKDNSSADKKKDHKKSGSHKKRKTTMWSSQKKKKGSSSLSGINEPSAASLFDELVAKEEDSNVVTMEGIVLLGEKLGIDAVEDLRILVLLWKMGCQQKPGCITRNEWMQGCAALGVDAWPSFQNVMPTLDTGFLTNTEFKDFYKFCFQFNRQGTHRTLDKDLVVALLKLVLTGRVPSERVDSFIRFLENSENPQYAKITLDQWTSFWDFCQECPDLSCYDESSSAWPVLIDEYVEFMEEKVKKT